MEENQHPLFFEANNLTDKDKIKIRRYFQIRRESGGGDCGIIEKTGHNTYKICFEVKEDQQRVLLRKCHTISLPSGELQLRVSSISSPQTTNLLSSQTFAKNNKCLEKIFKVDIYLLFFLRDNSKAYKVLQKQLSAIDCSVEIDFDLKQAVVREETGKAHGRLKTEEDWEKQVDRVFFGLTQSYVCHHVLDPEQIRVLKEDPALDTDDIGIYIESRYSVIVGEVGAVNERIANLKKSMPIRKEVPIVEENFRLVEEEFLQDINKSYPEVTIFISNVLVILQGPDKEVQSGVEKLDRLMKKIMERKVNLPQDLFNFVKSSGATLKFQARFKQLLKNPVSLEVGSSLVLSSSSSCALDEAEAAIQRDLRVDTVQLQGVDEGVKYILNNAKNEENYQGLKVHITFIPGLRGTAVEKVRFVGYTENVNKLKEVLHDYQMNHVGAREVVKLPPEIVDCFDELLDLIQMPQKVTLEASHFPHPRVLASGPRCLVLEAQANLKAALAGLISDTLVLGGLGAQRFFQVEGKMNMELVQNACKVIIREQQNVSSQHQKTQPQIIKSPSPISFTSLQTPTTNLEIKLGSLEDEQVHVLVAPMLNKVLTSTTIGKCLLDKAGDKITRNFDLMAAKCTLNPGDVLQVDAPPSLGCNKIFFIECLPWDRDREQSEQTLCKGLKRCLELCMQQQQCSVAFPIIGPGVELKYPLSKAIEVLIENIQQFGLSASFKSLSTIHVVIKPNDVKAEECYYDVHRLLSLNRTQEGQVIFRSITSDLDEITITVGGGVKLQVVFSDITKETTEAIVNTTDFVHFHYDGVCKDILNVAGPEIETELKAAKVKRGEIFVTNSGSFPCKAILHVCGKRDAGFICQLMCDIINHCETFGLKSVAIPAICAGNCGMYPSVVAWAILQGIKTTTSSTLLCCLADIRLVLNKIDVFLAFKEEAMQIFALINRASALYLPQIHHHHQQPLLANTDLSPLHTQHSSTNQNSVFLFLGLSRENVSIAMTKLKDLYQAQCSTETFTKELEDLTQDDINDLEQLVETQGLYWSVQTDQSGQVSLTVSGLKDGVTQVMQMMNGFKQDSLIREVKVKEGGGLYNHVARCILM